VPVDARPQAPRGRFEQAFTAGAWTRVKRAPVRGTRARGADRASRRTRGPGESTRAWTVPVGATQPERVQRAGAHAKIAPMQAPRLLMRLPIHVVNGVAVAIGIALIQGTITVAAGPFAALSAGTGSICSSLADQAVAPERTWRRVGMAAIVAWASQLMVAALRHSGVTMGFTVMLLAFCAAMVLSWGLRAAPLSFIPVLALVFTLAAPPPPDVHTLLVHSAWTAVGGLLYFGWAVASSRLLQPRYRTLALANALDALAALLRSRAALHTAAIEPETHTATPPLQEWIRSQVVLDERVQAARDLLFPAAGRPETGPAIAVLLQAVEMRDTLLAGELDLDLLGHDAAALALRRRLRARSMAVADEVEAMARALREHGLRAAGERMSGDVESDARALATAAASDDEPMFSEGDARHPLAAALHDRARHMTEALARMQAALRGEATAQPLAHSELQVFISAEGWPWQALAAQLSLDSPIFRHAVRLSVALGTAYFVGLALPWASHPHWLVLSVAVVMRGNLEQTLSRRDDRVLGTMIGCLLVLALGHFTRPWIATAAFLVSVGIAHSYATARYIVTCAAASVMALMQAHLAQPEAGFGAIERIGDTVLGAALAWGFSYLWPWWEKRGVPRLVDRVLKSLCKLSDEVLRLPDPGRPDTPLRLARREVYEAVGAIASAAQRTGAEPASVQVPMYALAEMLTRCHVLMAQLLAVRLLLARRRSQLDPGEASAALEEARAGLMRMLRPGVSAGAPGGGASPPGPAETAGAIPSEDIDHVAVPAALPDSAVFPWLERRLRLAQRAAQRVGLAAQALRVAVR